MGGERKVLVICGLLLTLLYFTLNIRRDMRRLGKGKERAYIHYWLLSLFLAVGLLERIFCDRSLVLVLLLSSLQASLRLSHLFGGADGGAESFDDADFEAPSTDDDDDDDDAEAEADAEEL